MAVKQLVRASEGSLPKELIKPRKKVNRIFCCTGTKKTEQKRMPQNNRKKIQKNNY